MELSTNRAATLSDKASLKTTIAAQLNLTESSIRNFEVTSSSSSSSSRRYHRRTLLATFTWNVGFEVAAPLSTTGHSSSDDFATAMATTLADVATAASASLGVAVTTVTPATATVVTRSPTLAPFAAPASPVAGALTPAVSSLNDDDGKFGIGDVGSELEQASLMSVGIVAVVVLFLCAGCVFCSVRRANAKQRGKVEEDDAIDPELTMSNNAKTPSGLEPTSSHEPNHSMRTR